MKKLLGLVLLCACADSLGPQVEDCVDQSHYMTNLVTGEVDSMWVGVLVCEEHSTQQLPHIRVNYDPIEDVADVPR